MLVVEAVGTVVVEAAVHGTRCMAPAVVAHRILIHRCRHLTEMDMSPYLSQ